MDMPNIPNPPPTQTFHQNDAALSNPETDQAPRDNPNNAESSPSKRRPGRPKGSTRKHSDTPQPPKVKRPVGRPRKDGFPAGSVGPPRSRPPKHQRIQPATGAYYSPGGNALSAWPTNLALTGVGYPQMGFPSISSAGGNGAAVHFPIDPNLELDDWANLARTAPNAFLTTLLAALAAPNPVSSAGPSVEEAFKSHLGSLAPNPSQMQPIPSLYSILKTFWLPSSPAYFSLTASASTARTPSEHRFLYWDPQPLVFNGISCPSCSSSLINGGRISSGPIKIYDIEKPFFIIGCEYVCKSPQCVGATNAEGRKFASTDSSILRSLPIRLKDEFPARLMHGDTDAGSGPNVWNWKASGVSLSLWNMVLGCLKSGLRRDAILHLIYAIQYGVPRDGEPKKEQPAVNKEGEDEDAMSLGANNKAPPDSSSGLPGNSFIDAYSDAWKENSGIAEFANAVARADEAGASSTAPKSQLSNTSSSSPTQRAASTPTPASASAPPAQAQPQPQPQPFEFSKAYASFPYAQFAFFPTAPHAGQQSTTDATASAHGSGSGSGGGGNTSPPPTPGMSSSENVPAPLKRPYPFSDDALTGGTSDSGSPAQDSSQKRSPRHCSKCGSQDCKGKGGRSFCVNPCQDCGKLDCRGRNSRRPDKKCGDGWH